MEERPNITLEDLPRKVEAEELSRKDAEAVKGGVTRLRTEGPIIEEEPPVQT